MASNLTGAAATTSTYTLPSSIKTTNQAKKEEEQKVLNGDGGAMGQTAFLTLFTTQLQNQNPLDPMENEAFVAQLAQFSQLEATTKMSDNLQNLVASMSNERMSSMSGLLGKKIAISDGKALLSGGQPVEGAVTLANDVDSITLKVFSSSGQLVRTGEVGAQKKGDFLFSWDGKDDQGNPLGDGVYRMEASATRFGKSSKAPVSTMAMVKSVTTDAATGDLQVELEDGSKVSMTQIKRVGF
ncbi:MAG: Basal-body rod modification protein FlgD [Pseudomonadota bacterium]|jgi:flagellar basal-body rod modification protein FlgD